MTFKERYFKDPMFWVTAVFIFGFCVAIYLASHILWIPVVIFAAYLLVFHLFRNHK